jgi:hypothetical protein
MNLIKGVDNMNRNSLVSLTEKYSSNTVYYYASKLAEHGLINKNFKQLTRQEIDLVDKCISYTKNLPASIKRKDRVFYFINEFNTKKNTYNLFDDSHTKSIEPEGAIIRVKRVSNDNNVSVIDKEITKNTMIKNEVNQETRNENKNIIHLELEAWEIVESYAVNKEKEIKENITILEKELEKYNTVSEVAKYLKEQLNNLSKDYYHWERMYNLAKMKLQYLQDKLKI